MQHIEFGMQRLIFHVHISFLPIIANTLQVNTVRNTPNVISVNKLLYYYKFKSVV
jgi:hypothetical protein